MRYPRSFIDDLNRQADIVRIVSDYVQLKERGNRWVACCPFHKEKTPSFGVSPAKGAFYCFGCQKGGGVIDFVMEIERVAFPEAIGIVAQKAGVALPKMENDQRFEARRQEADDVIRLNAWALDFWQTRLDDPTPDAGRAREYIESREISAETRKTFRLGYAPDSWDALTLFLKSKGASAQQIEQSGLVVKKDNGGSYDRFRGRLIFPVFDLRGRVIAFGGRALAKDSEPKYLNSPETAAYTKGRQLYGLHASRDHIRRLGYAILVEGYLDFLIPYQAGVGNVVATLGTALTPEQAKLMARFARKVVVNYDGDRAGVQAAKRALDILLAEDFEIKVLTLPGEADPDEFIRRNGVEAYQQLRGSAPPHIQFVLEQAARDHDLHRPPEKAAAVEGVLSSVRAVRNPIQQREYFDIAMDALRIDEQLRRELWRTTRSGKTEANPAGVPRVRLGRPTLAEQRLLEVLVNDDEVRRAVLSRIEPEDFTGLRSEPLFRALIENDSRGSRLDFASLDVGEDDDPEFSAFIAELLISVPATTEENGGQDALVVAEGCLNALRVMRTERRINELAAEMAAAERVGDQARLNSLTAEQLKWTRRRTELNARGGLALAS